MKRVARQAATLAGIKGALIATLFHVNTKGNKMMVEDPCELWFVLTESTKDGSTTRSTPTFVAEVKQVPAGSEDASAHHHVLSQEDGSTANADTTGSTPEYVEVEKQATAGSEDDSRRSQLFQDEDASIAVSTGDGTKIPATSTLAAAAKQAAPGFEDASTHRHVSAEDNGSTGNAKRPHVLRDDDALIPVSSGDGTTLAAAAKQAAAGSKDASTRCHVSAEHNGSTGNAKRAKSAPNNNRTNSMRTAGRASMTHTYDHNAAMMRFQGQQIDLDDFCHYLVDKKIGPMNIARVIPKVKQLMSGEGVPYCAWYVSWLHEVESLRYHNSP